MNGKDLELDKKKIASRIRARRNELGLSQTDLAESVGANDYTVISRYERSGRVPNTELIAKLAVALNVSIDWLLGLSEDKARH